MEFLDRLQAEWPVIEKAPLAFAVAVFVVGGAVWAIVHALYRQQIGNLKSRLDLKDGQIADYERKSSVATQKEVKAGEGGNPRPDNKAPKGSIRIATYVAPGTSLEVTVDSQKAR